MIRITWNLDAVPFLWITRNSPHPSRLCVPLLFCYAALAMLGSVTVTDEEAFMTIFEKLGPEDRAAVISFGEGLLRSMPVLRQTPQPALGHRGPSGNK